MCTVYTGGDSGIGCVYAGEGFGVGCAYAGGFSGSCCVCSGEGFGIVCVFMLVEVLLLSVVTCPMYIFVNNTALCKSPLYF